MSMYSRAPCRCRRRCRYATNCFRERCRLMSASSEFWLLSLHSYAHEKRVCARARACLPTFVRPRCHRDRLKHSRVGLKFSPGAATVFSPSILLPVAEPSIPHEVFTGQLPTSPCFFRVISYQSIRPGGSVTSRVTREPHPSARRRLPLNRMNNLRSRSRRVRYGKQILLQTGLPPFSFSPGNHHPVPPLPAKRGISGPPNRLGVKNTGAATGWGQIHI